MWKFYNKFLIFLLWIMKIRLVTALASAVLCARIPGLSPIQRQLCAEAPDALIALGDGHRLGAQECQHQFRGHRWNCSQVWQKGVFGHIMFIGSREAAFTYAVASAGAVHAVTASCARGNISLCGCEMMQKTTHDYTTGRQHHPYYNQQEQQQQQMHMQMQQQKQQQMQQVTPQQHHHQLHQHHSAHSRLDRSHRNHRSLNNNSSSQHGVKYKSTESTFQQQPWKWGGCSVDINFGIKFARKFLDVREIEGDERSLMNLHNNRVGRRIVKKLLRLDCKCHGVSGSCVMKTCWNSLPPFRLIGDVLMKKYDKARLVRAVNGTNGLILVLKNRGDRYQRHPQKFQFPKRMEMVYVEPSPNYCERNLTLDSLGTNDRKCNRTAQGIDGCDLLCCGRGYNTHQINRSWQCHCKFQWCCNVQCEECHEHYEEYTCK